MAGNNKITRKENRCPVSFSSGYIRKSGRCHLGNRLTSGKLHFEIEPAGPGASCLYTPGDARGHGESGKQITLPDKFPKAYLKYFLVNI